VDATLNERHAVTVADVLDRFPATQGLASVAGLLLLGFEHGTRTSLSNTVTWESPDGRTREAVVPELLFTSKFTPVDEG